MTGLSTAFSFTNILLVIGGCLIGTFIGMLPGLGPMSIIAIMIPVAITVGDPASALILLAGVYYGAVFGGSTSSILINAPGVASTVATSFDGYPLTRQGKAGKALTVAAISSFVGGTVGAILLLIFAPALASVALLFHSSEYFALMVVGLSAIAAFAGTGQVAKALLMTFVGLMMATVGEGVLFNSARFTMGIIDLQSGFGFVTIAMAMFALPEAIYLILDPNRSKSADGTDNSEIKDLRITRAEALSIAPVIGRQSLQGFFIGVLPGLVQRLRPPLLRGFRSSDPVSVSDLGFPLPAAGLAVERFFPVVPPSTRNSSFLTFFARFSQVLFFAIQLF